MRVKTNLTAKELELAGRGLQALAKSQNVNKSYKSENPAERELLRKLDYSLDMALENMQAEISDLLLKD